MSDKTDDDDTLRWIDSAEVDFETAKLVVRKGDRFAFAACFHAQQCAEKYLKAILLGKEVGFPRIHDLVALHRLCELAGVLLPFEASVLAQLSSGAVATRYPDDHPSLEEAKESIKTAKAIRKFARKSLGLK